MNKKAQSIKEFIITYGWVILIVIGSITILTYLGFSPSILPERCYFPNGLNCIDYTATSDGLQLVLENNLDKSIKIRNINISKPNCAKNFNTTVLKNEEEAFYINCSLESGKILNSELIIIYDEVDEFSDIRKIGIVTKKIS